MNMKNSEMLTPQELDELCEMVQYHWETEGIEFTTRTLLTDDPYPIYEGDLLPWAQDILGDVDAMLEVLGYDSLDQYKKDLQEAI